MSGESGADRAALLYDTAQIAEPYVLGPSRCTADYHQSDCTRIMQFSCCILQVVLRSAADRHYQTWSEGPARGCVGAQQWGDDCTYVASCTRSTEYTPREMWQRTNCTCVPAVVFSLFLNKLFGLWRRSFRSFWDESRFENVSQIKLLWLFCLHFRSKKKKQYNAFCFWWLLTFFLLWLNGSVTSVQKQCFNPIHSTYISPLPTSKDCLTQQPPTGVRLYISLVWAGLCTGAEQTEWQW